MARLLVADDEPNLLYSLQKSLQSESLQVITVPSAKRALEIVLADPPDAVILNVRLPDMSGMEAFQQIRQMDPRLPVIIITAFASTETAIEAMKRGAFEYLLKPLDFYQLREVVGRAVELSRMRHVPAAYEQEQAPARLDRLVGRSPGMQEVFKDIGRVAPQDVTVLIRGESGTGKELVARAIFHHSRRSDAPFLAINCAAIPEGLLESELFGHERGAFTGAVRRRIGKFEQVNGGTVLLDEIGDMGLSLQAKVLRLLQEQCFERVGDNQTIQTNVRIIAVTNKNLEELVAEGKFREDLYYRLKVFSIHVPPLRERLEDVPLLVDHFVRLFGGQLGKQIRTIPAESLHVLTEYSWPGNVRELQSVIKYALIHTSSDALAPELLLAALPERKSFPALGSCRPVNGLPANEPSFDLVTYLRGLIRAGEADVYQKVRSKVDRIVLEEVLGQVNGNQAQASGVLGISRTTLRSKLQDMSPVIGRADQKMHNPS